MQLKDAAAKNFLKTIAAVISFILHIIILCLQFTVIVMIGMKKSDIQWVAEVITALSYFAISLAAVVPLAIMFCGQQSNCCKRQTKRKRRAQVAPAEEEEEKEK